MSFYYECRRCNHIFKLKGDILRHLRRVNPCKIINNLEKTELDLYNESITKIYIIKK